MQTEGEKHRQTDRERQTDTHTHTHTHTRAHTHTHTHKVKMKPIFTFRIYFVDLSKSKQQGNTNFIVKLKKSATETLNFLNTRYLKKTLI